ncbi:hypothetical protein BAE36_09180 [Rhizobium leguminosarum bv. trifolii]|jgi:hypothetical protein|nr:hypothetical protein BAE36_09180 [Rhizobium leguminosarum bv. trifolii]
MLFGRSRASVGLKMFFGKPVRVDDVNDDNPFRCHPVEGDVAHVEEPAKASAEFVALFSHGGSVGKKHENPVPVEKIGVCLRLAEVEASIFVDA